MDDVTGFEARRLQRGNVNVSRTFSSFSILRRSLYKRSRSETSRGRSIASLTGAVVTAGAYRGRRNFGATSRFTALSLSFDMLPTIAMNGGHQTIVSSRIFHFVFVAAKRRLFSPRNRRADGAAAKARWMPSRRKNTSQLCGRRQDRFKSLSPRPPGSADRKPQRARFKLVF
jgi:hypothetical protein